MPRPDKVGPHKHPPTEERGHSHEGSDPHSHWVHAGPNAGTRTGEVTGDPRRYHRHREFEARERGPAT